MRLNDDFWTNAPISTLRFREVTKEKIYLSAQPALVHRARTVGLFEFFPRDVPEDLCVHMNYMWLATIVKQDGPSSLQQSHLGASYIP
jgi:hypothetical protein